MGKNTKGEKSKELIIKCAALLFIQKGYTATGINDILKIADLPKGSFYFYFNSKKDLAIAVAEYFIKLKRDQILEAAEGRTWDEFVEKLVGNLIKVAEKNSNYGCPVAVLGTEIAFSEPDIAKKYSSALPITIDIFANVLKKSGMPEEKVIILAERAFAVYQGRLLFYRLSRDVSELEKLITDMKVLVQK